MNDTQAVQLLQEMIEIESLSGGEGRHAAFLVEQMIANDYTKACVDEAGNAVGEMGDPAAPRTIVLLGHQDTVPGRIPVRIEDGRLFGPACASWSSARPRKRLPAAGAHA